MHRDGFYHRSFIAQGKTNHAGFGLKTFIYYKFTMQWTIRNTNLNDAQGIINILNPIIIRGRYTALDTPFSLEEEESFIKEFPESGIFHVATSTQSDKILGFQTLERFATYSHAFDHVGVIGTYVDNAYRRQGIASLLFESTFKAAKNKGYEKILTFVRSDNEPGLATYLKHGFNVIGTAKKHVKINRKYVDEIMIEKLF